MSTIDITSPHVLRGVPKELREHVKAAALLGWTGRKRGQGGLILYSPDGEHTVLIPITVNRVNTAKGIARDIVRYTPDDVKVSVTGDAVDNARDADIVSLGTIVRDAQGVFPPAMVAQLEPEIDSTETAYVTPEGVPAVSIVSVEPWMARVSSDGASSDLYPSQATMERTWSDGSKDYICSFCEEFTSESPRSVSSHYGRKHTAKGQTPGVDVTPTQFDQKIDGYRTKRVAHLTKEIQAALDSMEDGELLYTTDKGTGPLARYLATHIVAERFARGRERIEEEPEAATPEDLIARIRALLLRDEHKQVEVAETQAANLRAQIVEIEKSRDHFKNLAEQRGSALTTLAALGAEAAAGD